MDSESTQELTVEEYLDLLNGRIEGLTMSISILAISTLPKESLTSAHSSLSNTIDLIEEIRTAGEIDHLSDEYVRGTLSVLEKVANRIEVGE